CVWRLGVSGAGHDELCEKVAGVIAAPSLVVTRERKGNVVTDDIRPGILALRVVEGVEVECELATQPRAVRPGELVRAIDPVLAAHAGDGTGSVRPRRPRRPLPRPRQAAPTGSPTCPIGSARTVPRSRRRSGR